MDYDELEAQAQKAYVASLKQGYAAKIDKLVAAHQEEVERVGREWLEKVEEQRLLVAAREKEADSLREQVRVLEGGQGAKVLEKDKDYLKQIEELKSKLNEEQVYLNKLQDEKAELVDRIQQQARERDERSAEKDRKIEHLRTTHRAQSDETKNQLEALQRDAAKYRMRVDQLVKSEVRQREGIVDLEKTQSELKIQISSMEAAHKAEAERLENAANERIACLKKDHGNEWTRVRNDLKTMASSAYAKVATFAEEGLREEIAELRREKRVAETQYHARADKMRADHDARIARLKAKKKALPEAGAHTSQSSAVNGQVQQLEKAQSALKTQRETCERNEQELQAEIVFLNHYIFEMRENEENASTDSRMTLVREHWARTLVRQVHHMRVKAANKVEENIKITFVGAQRYGSFTYLRKPFETLKAVLGDHCEAVAKKLHEVKFLQGTDEVYSDTWDRTLYGLGVRSGHEITFHMRSQRDSKCRERKMEKK